MHTLIMLAALSCPPETTVEIRTYTVPARVRYYVRVERPERVIVRERVVVRSSWRDRYEQRRYERKMREADRLRERADRKEDKATDRAERMGVLD